MTNEGLKSDGNGPTPNWQNILWREWHHCDDQDYALRLYKAVYRGPLSWFSRIGLGKQPRPYAAEVEKALRQACQIRPGARHVWQRRLERLDQTKDKAISLQKLTANLQDHHWLERFTARQALLDRGGEAVELLLALAQDDSAATQPVAWWLLQSIAVDTSVRLARQADTLLCPRCLVCFQAQPIPVAWQPDLTFYGCRVCRQSRSFQTRPADMVMVLDMGMAVEQMEQDRMLRVNWFHRRALFDFDRVEIIQANDEEVERFAVLVGNDTDPVREPRYKLMTYTIAPTCLLSENTMRILERTFGEMITYAPHL
jgi:hypothetical protein